MIRRQRKKNGNGKHRAADQTDASAAKRRPLSLIVGIGASAGGLAAFKSFFANMPADTGMAFVLVQHLDPHHKSMLVELLRPHTAMPRPAFDAASACGASATSRDGAWSSALGGRADVWQT